MGLSLFELSIQRIPIGERLTLATGSTEVLPDILRHLVAAGADVFEFAPEKLSLEDLFLKIMGEDRGL